MPRTKEQELICELGGKLRGLYEYARLYAPTTDLSDVQASLNRFEHWNNSTGEFAPQTPRMVTINGRLLADVPRKQE